MTTRLALGIPSRLLDVLGEIVLCSHFGLQNLSVSGFLHIHASLYPRSRALIIRIASVHL